MKKILLKYCVWCLVLLSVNAAAQTRSQAIKINPDLISLAQNRVSNGEDIRTINYVWTLQEKEKTLYYAAADDFFSDNKVQNADVEKATSSKVKQSRKALRSKYAINKNLAVNNSSIVKKQPVSSIAATEKSDTKIGDADKINDALKIPINSQALKTSKKAASFGPSASEIRERAFNDIKKKNPEIEQKSLEKQQRGKNLMWAGLVLVVLGGIMGFVFGRSAFLIAVAGIVFAGIGYFFRI